MADVLPKNQRIIGLDVGDKAVGVAVSDVSGTVATPYAVIDRKKFMKEIKTIITEKSPCGFVVGMPLEMNGGKGPRYQSVKAFTRTLEKETALPVLFHDERFSSRAVENMMLRADMSRQRRNELSDKLAAAYILQGWLEGRRIKDEG